MATAASDMDVLEKARRALAHDYVPSEDEEYMGAAQQDYFRLLLLEWKRSILSAANATLQSLHYHYDPVGNITDSLGNLGYAFVDVRPQVERDRENLLIKLTYDVQEGPRVFVERIDIETAQEMAKALKSKG